jgi:hypothetical protein
METMETEHVSDGNSMETMETEHEIDGNSMETMETGHVNDGIEWKQHGNNGNRTCRRWNRVEKYGNMIGNDRFDFIRSTEGSFVIC